MSDILSLPAEYLLPIIGFATLYFLAANSPLLVAAVTAWRRGNEMTRRILFIGWVAVFVYGLLPLLSLAVWPPVQAFVTFVVPSMRAKGYLEHSWLLKSYDFLYTWWWVGLPLFVLVVAILVTRYFALRWNKIVAAIAA